MNPPSLPDTQPPSAPRTDELAIASLVLGIMSLVLSILTGIPALILGILSLRKIDKSAGQLRGRGKAIAGVVMGCVGIVIVLPALLLAALLFPAIQRAREQSYMVVCESNVRQLDMACVTFAADNNGKLPNRWEDLNPYLGGGDMRNKMLICPKLRGKTGTVSYELLTSGEYLSTLKANSIIIRERDANHLHKRVVGCADGHVQVEEEK